MWSAAHILCVLVALWASGLCHTLLTVGSCMVNRKKASEKHPEPQKVEPHWNILFATFDCSRQNLTSVPEWIWFNVTKLDLSGNHLNLAHTRGLKELQHFDRLSTLNLSGNYLPLLVKQHFYPLPSLQILDLSDCKLAMVEADAFLSFPKLKKVFLGNNYLQLPLLDILHSGWVEFVDLSNNHQLNEVKRREHRIHKLMTQERHSKGDVLDMIIQSHSQRKLLTEVLEGTTVANTTNNTVGTGDGKSASEGWKPLVAVLVTAIAVSILIAVGAKCKIVHRYLASYRHSRLSEADTASHCDPASFEVGFSTQAHPRRGQHSAPGEGNGMEEDDDGFIEDNYIQASERERAQKEAEWEEEEDEDDMDFTIG